MIKHISNFIVLAVFATYFVSSEKSCNLSDARKSFCSDIELCVDGHCQCKPGYTSLNNECVKNSSNPAPRIQPATPDVTKNNEHSHVAIAIVIPVFLIIFIIASVILVRKYNLVSWISNKINQRNTPYDEVMIGQEDDDPPLSTA